MTSDEREAEAVVTGLRGLKVGDRVTFNQKIGPREWESLCRSYFDRIELTIESISDEGTAVLSGRGIKFHGVRLLHMDPVND